MPIQQLPGTAVVPNSIGSSAISTTVSFGPKISAIAVTDSGYTVLDDTAVSVAGGYIKITGTGFVSGCTVVIGTQLATSVSFVSSTEIRAQIPAQAAGSYIVYLTNPDGGIAIRVNAVNYSATPTWTTTSPLADGLVDSAISIQFAASSNSTVVYALQAGSTLPPGLTLNSSGLLSGTVTNLAVTTTYNFTVVATDLELQDTPRAFAVTINAADLNFKHVTALLSANTAASTFISDASANAVEFTIVGDTRPNNVNPFTPGYHSNFFDGNGDWLSIADNAAFTFGTGDFTVECWIYTSSATATYAKRVINHYTYTNADYGWSLGVFRTGGSTINFSGHTSNTLALNLTYSGALTASSWHHIAVVRSGSNASMYLDGVRVATQSGVTWNDVNTIPAGLEIGSQENIAGTVYDGCISNVRIVKGTAVYNPTQTTIAVPTAPLTAIAGTSLLTCQGNRFIDNSTNNFTVTRNGNVAISHFNPFLPDSSYSSYGCGYFDGTGDRISTPNISAFDLSSSDPFTIEAWIYPTATNTYLGIFGARQDSVTHGWCLYVSNNNTLYMGSVIVGQSYADRQLNTTPIIPNAWTHVALVKEATFYKAYVNGVGGTAINLSGGLQYQSGQPLVIGALGSQGEWPFMGGITNARIVKGTAVYTSNFTPSNAPLTAIANTQLLTLQRRQSSNNIAFVDNSNLNALLTRYGNPYQGSFSPYGGGWSNYFDGSGDALTVAGNSALDLTGDFTIEFWANMQSDTNYLCNGTQVGSGCWRLTLQASTGTAIFDMAIGSWAGLNLSSAAGSFTKNVWAHFAVTRSGNTFRLFINGAVAATTTNSGSLVNTGRDTQIGYYTESSGTYYSQWYLSNLRIVKGTAVYTTAFTPSATPLTAIAGTSLLTCADNRFIDDSANNFTITRSGDVAVQRFNPWNPVTTTPTSYSAYFDGTGDIVSAASDANLIFGTGDFTVECWINSGSQPGSFNTIIGGDTNGAMLLTITGSGTSTGVIVNPYGAANIYNQSYTFTQGTWFHIAVTRSGTSLRLFVNGTQLGSTVTDSTNFSAATRIIGGAGTSLQNFAGYVSNARIVKGTAVYTANFTPSTTPLTAIANTSLLTCQSATFVDNSTNAFTLTANGDAAPRQFNPFGQTSSAAAYTPALYGGSAYFDGSGDFIYTPGLSNWNFASRNFTIEGWFYFDNGSANSLIPMYTNYETFGSAGSIYWGKHNNQSGVVTFWLSNHSTAGPLLTEPTLPPSKAWTHYAVVRNGNTFTMYRNGVATVSSTAFTGAATTGDPPLYIATVGENETVFFTGFISDFRIVNGTALYTSNFVPPVAPLTLTSATVNNTVLLCNMTGAGIYDSSMMTNYETVGNAGIRTSIKKYGNTSMYFDGSGDRLVIPNIGTANFGTGDFTVEAWVYLTGSGGGYPQLLAAKDSPNLQFAFQGTSLIYFYNGTTSYSYTYSPGVNQWAHVAWCRSSGTFRIFVNGTSVGSFSYTTAINLNAVLVGAYNNGTANGDFQGYISDLRVTCGVARYTTTFTPPTSQLIQR